MENPTGNPKIQKPETEMQNRNPELFRKPETGILNLDSEMHKLKKKVLHIRETFFAYKLFKTFIL